LTSGYCFTIATKGELDSITKGVKDTLKISTKGEFFYIRTGTNYKAGTTGGIDRNVPVHKLSWPAILNIKADKIATNALDHAAIRSISMEVTNNPIRLQMDSEIITLNELKILRWRWREFVLQEYLESKFNITHLELHTINWAAIQIARKRLPSELQPFSVKLMITWLPVGTRMAKYGNNMTMCNFCNEDEDFNHL
jgi:hypothetical protein